MQEVRQNVAYLELQIAQLEQERMVSAWARARWCIWLVSPLSLRCFVLPWLVKFFDVFGMRVCLRSCVVAPQEKGPSQCLALSRLLPIKQHRSSLQQFNLAPFQVSAMTSLFFLSVIV